MTEATWEKGKRTIKGCWRYNWAANNFTVTIYKRDPITGDSKRTFRVYDDTPEWNGWKLRKEKEDPRSSVD